MSRAQFCPLLLSIGLLLAGCASYSGIQGEAHALVPQSLAFHAEDSSGAWPREDWWTMFGEPKLDALMQQALQGNPSLRAAQACRPRGTGRAEPLAGEPRARGGDCRPAVGPADRFFACRSFRRRGGRSARSASARRAARLGPGCAVGSRPGVASV